MSTRVTMQKRLPLEERVGYLERHLMSLLDDWAPLDGLRLLTLCCEYELDFHWVVSVARTTRRWEQWSTRVAAAIDRARERAHREEGSR